MLDIQSSFLLENQESQLSLTVKSAKLAVMEITGKGATSKAAKIGVTTGNTTVVFEKADQQSPLNLTGKAKTYVHPAFGR